MKKIISRLIILSIITTFLGGVVYTIGFLNGGKKGFYINKSGIQIINNDELSYKVVYPDKNTLKNIEIDVVSATINVYHSPLDSLLVEHLYYPELYQSSIETIEDKVVINQKNDYYFMMPIPFRSLTTKEVINIALPSNLPLNKLTIKVVNGSINLNEVKIEDVNISSYNSAINLSSVYINHFESKVINGALTIGKDSKDSTINEIMHESKNGEIRISRLTSHNLDLSTLNGKVTLSTLLNVNELDVSTRNGEMSLTSITANKLIASTDNGLIKTSSLTISEKTSLVSKNGALTIRGKFLKELYAKTSNGKIDYRSSDSKVYYDLDLKTSNGSNYINDSKLDSKHYTYIKSNPNKLTLVTYNGDVVVSNIPKNED